MKLIFEVGDVVRLNSGSPDLTVSHVGLGPYGDDNVQVTWYDDDGTRRIGDFPDVCLKPVNTLSPFTEILKAVEEPRNTSIVDLWQLGKEKENQ